MLNSIAFYILAVLTLASAIAAMKLRNLVHCALCVAGAFAGIALIY
jgi:NADH-quinone oxidoreductase subunit J